MSYASSSSSSSGGGGGGGEAAAARGGWVGQPPSHLSVSLCTLTLAVTLSARPRHAPTLDLHCDLSGRLRFHSSSRLARRQMNDDAFDATMTFDDLSFAFSGLFPAQHRSSLLARPVSGVYVFLFSWGARSPESIYGATKPLFRLNAATTHAKVVWSRRVVDVEK
eukprot:COSAG02_NODE_714_length_18094_cov_13.275688_15_plen_165_part_00